MKGESVDLIIHNARIHTMDEQLNIEDAVAIKDGLIVEVGPERQILNKYSADEYIDAAQRDVYPGFEDAHAHLLGFARRKTMVELAGSKSYEEMLLRLEKFEAKYEPEVLVGFGWDQSLWGMTELPDNKKLNERFPDIPVFIRRVDGHSALVNQKMIEVSRLMEQLGDLPAGIEGGQVVLNDDGSPTGMLVDNAMGLMWNELPEISEEEVKKMMLEIQHDLFVYGITGIHEAGIDDDGLKLLEEMVSNGELELNIYGMLYPTKNNISFARKNGIYTNKNLIIRSFKVVGDGALGSRGACMKEPYSDKPGHLGFLTTPMERIREIARICEETGYQMNTHAIGDSTNKLILNINREMFERNPDHRWRLEHAQVVDVEDIPLFGKSATLPSVQPTHAISDQRWAEERIGHERLKGAYAYKSLLDQYGMVALGTDFPIEDLNPFRTIHAAVNRNTLENDPPEGFLKDEALSFDECMQGMTKWAAFASFQEDRLGTIEEGKEATIVIFVNPVSANPNFKQNFAHSTFIKGKKVYSVE